MPERLGKNLLSVRSNPHPASRNALACELLVLLSLRVTFREQFVDVSDHRCVLYHLTMFAPTFHDKPGRIRWCSSCQHLKSKSVPVFPHVMD